MPLYFMLHDAERFHTLIRPALAASWRQRSFGPCAVLRRTLESDLTRFLAENRIPEEQSVLAQIGAGLPFDRNVWRFLVGEVLLSGASELPEIPVPTETLCLLLSPPRDDHDAATRDRFTLIEQAIYGSRDLTFGGGWYRPDHAGYNDRDDVNRLAEFLAGIDAELWTTEGLASAVDLETKDDLADELEFVRASFPPFRGMYEKAQKQGYIVVCETI